jgi:GAF domain-containing protein
MSIVESEVRSPHLAAEHPEDLKSTGFLDGRERIARLTENEPDYRTLFARVMEVVKEFVEFEWAYLFIFTPGREYSRLVCRHGPRIEFEARWFETGEGYRDFITGDVTWIDDFENFLAAGPHPELLKRRDYRIAIEAGVKSLLCLPVWEGGDVIGGFCVQSKEVGTYKKEDRRKLELLMLGQAMLPVFHAADREERNFVSGLVTKIAASRDFQELARTVVDEIARFYEFQNVSIFKVNALRGHFRLLAQALGPQGGTAMPERYEQPLDEGLLGMTYREGGHVILRDVEDGSLEARTYKETCSEMRSELCIPIEMSGRILWILNVEDRHTDAFTLGEMKTLKGIIEQMQANLKRIFQRLILMQVLDVVPEAVVVTEQSGNVLHVTKDALHLLQCDSLSSPDNLSRFFPGAMDEFLAFDDSATLTKVIGGRGKETSVLAQKFELEDEYDHEVVVLRDVSQVRWNADSEHFKAALPEAASQLRVPVSLISSFIQQIRGRVQDEKVQELVDKAVRLLGRVELTYDRVLACYDAQALPAARKRSVDVNATLDQLVSELPLLERDTVKRSGAKKQTVVKADAYRLTFALSSMLAYLLRSRADAKPIEVSVRRVDKAVEISMTGPVQRSKAAEGLPALVEKTRTEIALGEGALKRMAGACGGAFERRRGRGREKLLLRLAVTN